MGVGAKFEILLFGEIGERALTTDDDIIGRVIPRGEDGEMGEIGEGWMELSEPVGRVKSRG